MIFQKTDSMETRALKLLRKLKLQFLPILVMTLVVLSDIKGQTFDFCGVFPPHSATSTSLDSIVYDRFGNTYDIYDGQVYSTTEQNCSSAGYFELVMLDVPSDWQTVVCQVFEDLSNVISQRTNTASCGDVLDPYDLRIRVTVADLGNDALGVGTPTYAPIYSACNQVWLSRSYLKINGGIPTGDFSAGFDGLLQINDMPPAPWHLDFTSNPQMGTLDLYSVILHEAIHILGFASLIDLDGTGTNFVYSLWDQHLHTSSNYIPGGTSPNIDEILQSDCSSNCWNLNATLFPTAPDFLNTVAHTCSSTGSLDVVFGDQAIAPILGGEGTVPTEMSELANMLSHLNHTCNGQNIDYVMQGSIDVGDARRQLDPAEEDILCELGYKLENCDGCFVGASLDIFGASIESCCYEDRYICVGESINISFEELLCNDFTNGNDLSIVDYYFAPNSGTNINISSNSTGINLTGVEQGTFRIIYTIEGCDCKMNNSMFTLVVGPCIDCGAQDPCVNLSCVNGFEDFDPFLPSMSSNSLNYLGVHQELLGRYWFHTLVNSPDICEEINGNKFVSLTRISGTPLNEGLAISLNEPIEPGCIANISFTASAFTKGALPNNVELYGSFAPPCFHYESEVNIGCITTDCGNSDYSPVCIDDIPVTTYEIISTIWFDNPNLEAYNYTWENQTSEAINYIIFSGSDVGSGTNILPGDRICLDDIVITKNCANPCFNWSVDCQTVSFNTCDPSINQTHFWDFGDGQNSTTVNPIHVYSSNGSFTVTHIVTDNCGNSITETLNLIIDCTVPAFACPCENGYNIGVPGQLTYLSNSTLPSLVNNDCIAIAGTLVIDQNFLSFNNEFRMQSGSSIVVDDGGFLNLSFSDEVSGKIHGCDKMWRGITVKPEGELYITYSVIEDAQFAVRLLKDSKLSATNNTFNKNYVGVLGEANGGSVQLQSTFSNNSFNCTSALLPPYNGQSPFPGDLTYAGIYLEGTNGFNIGVNNAPLLGNNFSGIKNGIIAERSKFSVHNATIDNMIGNEDDNFPWGISGKGIFMVECKQGWITQSSINGNHRGIVGMTSNARIEENTISSLSHGILFQNGTNRTLRANDNFIDAEWSCLEINHCLPATKVEVQGNTMSNQVNFVSAIEVSNSFPSEEGLGVISNNQLTMEAGSSGLYISSSKDWKVTDNTFSTLSGSAEFAGINLSGSDNCQIRDNIINGPTESTYNGIYAINSPSILYCCNSVSSTLFGLRIEGSCNGSIIGNTQFDGHFQGLRYDASGITGPQPWTGNEWLNNCCSNYEAFHAGGPDIAQFSIYFTGTSQTPTLFSPANWFFENSTITRNCLNWSDCGVEEWLTPQIESLDSQVVEKKLVDLDFGEVVQWLSEQSLYRKLLENPSIYVGNNLMEDFVDSIAIDVLGSLYSVEARKLSAFLYSSSLNSTINSYSNISNDILTKLDSFNLLLNTANSLDSINHLSGKKLLLEELDSISLLWESADSLRLIETIDSLNQISSFNTGISSTFLPEINEVKFNTYQIEYWLNGDSLPSNILDSLYYIGIQCPLVGGDAVYKSRGLFELASNSVKYWEKFQDCSLGLNEKSNSMFSTIEKDYKEVPSVLIYPNPSSNNLIIEISSKNVVEGKVYFFNLQGQVLLKQTLSSRVNSINHNLPTGVYICLVEGPRGILSREKVIIIN